MPAKEWSVRALPSQTGVSFVGRVLGLSLQANIRHGACINSLSLKASSYSSGFPFLAINHVSAYEPVSKSTRWDPLSVSASIIAVLEVTTKVVQVLHDLRHVSEDRRKLLVEIINVEGILQQLRDTANHCEEGDDWLATIRSLTNPDGALQVFRTTLEDLATKLTPVTGLRKAERTLKWPLEKKEIGELLAQVERLKALFSIAFQNDHIQLSKAIEEDTKAMKDSMKTLEAGVAELQIRHDASEDRFRSEEQRKVLDWLSSLKSRARQKDILSRREEGTGEWFLKSDIFCQWETGIIRTLWCPGIPGAGKTVMSSIIVDFLEAKYQGSDTAIAFLYCDYNDKSQTGVELISSLLQQVLQQSNHLPVDILAPFQKHMSEGSTPSLSEVSAALKTATAAFANVFIVVDALDECLDDDQHTLLQHVQGVGSHLHLLVTSRPIASIGAHFKNHLTQEIHATDQDIRRYLEDRVVNDRKLQGLVRSHAALQKEIVDKIAEKAQGMFLLSQLHINLLAGQISRSGVRSALKELRNTLWENYDKALNRMRKQASEEAALAPRVLAWIIHACRPLTITELQYGLAVTPSSSDLDEEALVDQDLLVSVCVGLVTIDVQSGIVRLVHYTIHDYFNHPMSELAGASAQLGSICMTYLSYQSLARLDISRPARGKMAIERDNPSAKMSFHTYARTYWADLVRGEAEHTFSDQIIDFIRHKSEGLMIDLFFTTTLYDACRKDKGFKELVVAVVCDLTHIFTVLIHQRSPAVFEMWAMDFFSLQPVDTNM